MVTIYGVEMEDKSVLDVGGYDGRFSAEALRQGAKSAVVIDNEEWRAYGWPEPGTADERITFVRADLLEWDSGADIVHCSNVLYHLRDPQEGLVKLWTLTGEAMILKTSFVADHEAEQDGWRWYPHGSGHSNGTVWARPSRNGLERALYAAGFKDVRAVDVGGANDEVVYVARG